MGDLNLFRSKHRDSSNLGDGEKESVGLPDRFIHGGSFDLNSKLEGADFSLGSIKKEGFVFGSDHVDDSSKNVKLGGGFDGIGGSMVTDEMRKLKIASETGDSRGSTRVYEFAGSWNLDSNGNLNSCLGGIARTELRDEMRNLRTASSGRGSIEKEGFVFGSNTVGGSGENSNLGSGFDGISGSMLPEEMRKLKIGSGVDYNGIGSRSSENDKNAGFSFKFGERGNLNSDSNSKSDSGLVGSTGTVLTDEMRKLKIGSGTRNNSDGSSSEGGFVSGISKMGGFGENPNSTGGFERIYGSMPSNEARKLNVTSETMVNVGGNPTSLNAEDAAFTFKFFERQELGSDSNRGFGGIAGSVLHDEMRKLNIASRKGDYGGTKSTSQNSNIADFSSRFGERGNSNSNSSSSSGSEGVTGSMLPHEMKQSKIGSGIGDTTGNNYTPQNAKDASFTFKFGERGNFGESSEKSTFVFGDNRKENPASNDSSGVGFGDIDVSVLPDELRKLKIGSTSKDSSSGPSIANISGSGRDFGTGVSNSLCKDKDAALHSKAGESGTFGRGNVSQQQTVFVSGTNMEESSGPMDSTGFLGAEIRLPDDMRKLNIGSRTRDSGGRKQKATSGTHIHSIRLHNLRNSHIAGIAKKGFSSSQSTSEEMESENLEAQVPHNLAGQETAPTAFTFQATNSGDGLTVDPGPPVEPKIDCKPSAFVGPLSSSSSSSSSLSSSPSSSNIFMEPPTEKTENKTEFRFGSSWDGSGHMDLEIPKQEPSYLPKEGVFSTPGEEPFTVLHPNLEFSAKGGAVKTMPKKRRGRRTQSASVHQRGGQNSFSALKEKNLQENPELDSVGGCSPMDFSPYEETQATGESSRGVSVASDDYVHPGANHMSIDSTQSIPVESSGGMPLAREELNEERLDHWFKGHDLGPGCSESVSSDPWRSSSVEYSFSDNVPIAKTEADFCNPKIEKLQTDNGEKFSFSLKPENANETNFTFAASPYTRGQSSRGRYHYKKKHGLKADQDTGRSTPITKLHSESPFTQLSPLANLQQGPAQVEPGAELDKKNNSSVDKELEVGKEFPVPCSVPLAQTVNFNTASAPTASVTAAALEACEKWRLRGNQAYANGDLSRAEDCYTRGANIIPPSETSRSCMKAIMLCHSNRAATRMSLGRMREALMDCMKAASIDPSFSRVQLRAANCHLALGEIEGALKQFNRCMESENNVSSDKKLIADASDGLRKAKLVAEHMDQSAELLRRSTSIDAINALDIINEALSISPYSELLLEMKAEALLVLRKYEEVIHLCEQTQDSAARNLSSIDDSASKISFPSRVWRSFLISKSYFQLGRLDESLDLLLKHEQMDPLEDKNSSRIPDSVGTFAATVRELLRHRAVGNEAFQAGKHLDAVEHYTAALTCNVESRPFTAICFCNRAAAYQALGQITDAIADCSLAIALDPNYLKAISRRATLHEMIRDYGQAQKDLQRLVPLLEKQVEDRASQSGILPRSGSNMNDLKQARLRLAAAEEEARKEIPLDMYLILGIDTLSSASDVKKAYRKAALRHHPDKAGQFLARNENGDDKLWKEIIVEVHRDADRLFKMIGEAYAILSEPIKRSRYDMEEEIRNVQKKGTGSSTSQTSADVHRHQWKAYGSSPHHRWSDTNKYS